VDATPLLAEVGRALADAGLETVLIGNAGAALRGAPVTTIDFDFLFRKTPRNLRKIRHVADSLRATVLRPYYPASDLYRLTRDDDGLQVDFMATVHGLRSFEGVRDRAELLQIGGTTIRVAALPDIIRSKRAAGRARDRAVLEILEQTHAQASVPPRQAGRARKRRHSRPR